MQNHPFHLELPSLLPLFTSISLFFKNLFIGLQNILSGFIDNNLIIGLQNILSGFIDNNLIIGLQNILSSFIDSNLWYCYLIFIFSILLTILLFILIIHAQKGYSVKMNNLPNNENSKKRKRKSETGNSRKKAKSENGDSGDSGSPDKNENKPKFFFPKEDEETKSYRCYMEKYDTCVRKNELCPRGTRKDVQDTFPSLYSEYKKYKPFNPDLEWENLTEVYFSTWDRQAFGLKRYADTDIGFMKAFDYMEDKKWWIITKHSKGKVIEASPLWKRAMANDFTTFKKYIEILDNLKR
nr:hypothetical protein ALT_mt0037 [Aspergillus lentulus]